MKMYGGVDVYIHILLTSTIAGGELSASCPSHLHPGKSSWYPLDRRMGEHQNRSGYMERRKIMSHWDSNPDPLVAQPIASHFTNCTIPPHNQSITNWKECGRSGHDLV
jgi:hypothetical protein